MKIEKHYLIVLFLILVKFSWAQNFETNHKKSVLLHLGAVSFPDIWLPENHYVLELGYKNILSKDFAYQVFLNRSYSNSTKPFFNDNTQLIQYLNNNDIGLFTWEKLQTYAVGLKGHFYFVNTPRAEFSFFTGSGVFFSKVVVQSARSVSFQPVTGQVFNVDKQFLEDKINGVFVAPGLAFRYWFWDNVAIGIDAMALFQVNKQQDEAFGKPLAPKPNFYSLAFSISFKL